MPKESVRDSTSPSRSLDVKWGVDSNYVEIHLHWDDIIYLGELPKSLPGCEQSAPIEYSGLSIQFEDRQQVNDLIRVLRRARDKAFGADA